MNKILEVIKPFFVMEVGDTFELSEDGSEYTSVYVVENHGDSDLNTIDSKYSSKYSISIDYAELLVKEGYLIEKQKESSDFVNVFDEIDELLAEYKEDLKNIDNDLPACVKVEKETVLTNMIRVLEHLKSLKK